MSEVLIVCERCTASHRFTLLPGPFGSDEINVAEIDAARWSKEFGGGLVCPDCGDA